jgi:YidC/Oxa1 family membrane protein insertase
MDKNSFIGLLLIGAILIFYSIYTAPTEEELAQARIELEKEQREEAPLQTETEAVIQEEVIDTIVESHSALSDSVRNLQQFQVYGDFANAAAGEEESISIETEDLIVNFSNKGGRIESVILKNYRKYDSTPLVLFDPEGSVYNLNFFTHSNNSIYTDELYFETTGESKVIAGSEELKVSYTLFTNDRQKNLTFNYTIPASGFLVDMQMVFNNMDQVVDRRSSEIGLNWEMDLISQEKGLENQRNNTTVYYKYADEDPDYLSETSDEKEDLVASVEWIAFKQQYFNTTMVADQKFDKYNSSIETKKDEESDRVKLLRAQLSVPFAHQSVETFDLYFFFGPNHYQTLEDMEIGLESLIPLGWGIFGWVNEWLVIPIFNFLDGFNMNYGIIILLMTIFIKVLLFPVTWKTYLSSAKMKVLKPEISEIGEKHKDDPMKKQQATMALYRQAGVNPLAGCVPMLIQMPILFAMFRFFPASIELRQQAFLWADDLSSYDSIAELPFSIPFYGDHVSLFTLLMAISMVFYTRINSGQMGLDAGGGATSEMAATQMKIMMYLMPIMMLFFFNNYSSGLSYYYFIANVISMGQMIAIKRWFIDEDKIHAKIQMNKAKPAGQKKSKFQKRLEEMAKQRGYQPKK